MSFIFITMSSNNDVISKQTMQVKDISYHSLSHLAGAPHDSVKHAPSGQVLAEQPNLQGEPRISQDSKYKIEIKGQVHPQNTKGHYDTDASLTNGHVDQLDIDRVLLDQMHGIKTLEDNLGTGARKVVMTSGTHWQPNHALHELSVCPENNGGGPSACNAGAWQP